MEREYESVSTSIPEVELRVIKGTKLEVPEEITKSFYKSSKEYDETKNEIKALTTEQKDRHDQFVKYIKAIPGLRGIRSQPDNFGLLVIEKESVSWDQVLLKASLGPIYSALVSEELVATITIPPGLISEEKLRDGLERLLKEFGVPLADIPKLLETDISLRIDTEKIDELVATERLQLLPGTREVEISWAVDCGPLKTQQKRKAAKKEKAT